MPLTCPFGTRLSLRPRGRWEGLAHGSIPLGATRNRCGGEGARRGVEEAFLNPVDGYVSETLNLWAASQGHSGIRWPVAGFR